MTATLISTSGNYTFGQMTNQATSQMVALQTKMQRLNEAIATASSGYDGTPGTEFEAPQPGSNAAPPNLFGVIPSDTPGEQGQAYRYAMGQLYLAWQTFWGSAQAYLEQLDNGTQAF